LQRLVRCGYIARCIQIIRLAMLLHWECARIDHMALLPLLTTRLCGRAVAGKTPEEIRKTFNIKVRALHVTWGCRPQRPSGHSQLCGLPPAL
jgi:hypothetical protein